MASIGDSVVDYFSGGKTDANNKLDQIFRQLYNVRPVMQYDKYGRPIGYAMPKGASERAQMLMPYVNAMVAQDKARADKGTIWGALADQAIKGGTSEAMRRLGDWRGIFDKIGGGVKSLWDSATGPSYSGAPEFTPAMQQTASDFDQAFSPGQIMPDVASQITPDVASQIDLGDPENYGELLNGVDLSNLDLGNLLDNIDYSSLFSDGDWAGMF